MLVATRAGRLREWPQGELRLYILYRALKVIDSFEKRASALLFSRTLTVKIVFVLIKECLFYVLCLIIHNRTALRTSSGERSAVTVPINPSSQK